jgi:SAM-dependent methyltransferase
VSFRDRLAALFAVPAAATPDPRPLIRAEVEAMLRLTQDGRPNANGLSQATRDLDAMRWNLKALAGHFGAEFEARAAQRVVLSPAVTGLASRSPRQQDFASDWLLFWARETRSAPRLHRGLWESCFIAQSLYEAGLIRQGVRGAAMFDGRNSMAALMASMGVATRIHRTAPAHDRPTTPDLEGLHYTDIVARDLFDQFVTAIWADDTPLVDDLDFVWAMQWMHHQGSIQAGLDAAKAAMRLLRPGGLLVITTELNLRDDETLDHSPTVLFQRRHFQALAEDLRADGHVVAAIDFDIGADVFDRYVDTPPYGPEGTAFPPEMLARLAAAPHIKVSVDGFPCTSFGFVVTCRG